MNLNLLDIPVYYINMDKDVERRESMERLLKEKGFKNVVRVRGVEGGGEYHSANWKVGCALSHQLTLSQLTPPFILLEDDCILGRGFKTEVEVPSGADAVYLGISKLGWSGGHVEVIGKKCDVKDLLKIDSMLSSHAILYLTRSYLSAAAYAAGEAVRKKDHVDVEFALAQVKYNIYACNPPIFHQSSCSTLTDVDLKHGYDKIAFVTLATKEIEAYSKYTTRVNSLYCKMHGYTFILEPNHLSERFPSWDKVLLMDGLFESFDLVFLMDADAMVIDFNTKIESFLSGGKNVISTNSLAYGRYNPDRFNDFYILDDEPLRGRPFSVGGGTIMCVVDTQERKEYFKKIYKRWWEMGEQLELEHKPCHEQTAMNVMLFELEYMGLDERTQLFDHEKIYKFVYHAYARSMEDRVSSLKAKMDELGITLDG
jgi:hypothetical protein